VTHVNGNGLIWKNRRAENSSNLNGNSTIYVCT
jgi:hypothetical protein